MVSSKKCILRISTITITIGISTFSTHKAIASEKKIDSQINLQPTVIDFIDESHKLNSKHQYNIAQTKLDLARFCKNYPFNSRCKDQNNLESTEEKIKSPPKTYDQSNQNEDNWAIITNASTLGLGGAVVANISPNLNARVGLNAFGFNITYEETRASYDADVNLFNVATTLDYYPFKNSGFYISPGVIYTNNNVDGVATASDIIEDVDLGGFAVDVDDLLSVNADVESGQNFAPYIGIGWGNPIAGGLRFWGNLGVMFPGSPNVELSPDFQFDENLIPNDIRQEIENELAEEENDIEDEIDRFNIYPVISLGLSYSF